MDQNYGMAGQTICQQPTLHLYEYGALKQQLLITIASYNKLMKAKTATKKFFNRNKDQQVSSGAPMRKQAIKAALASLYNDPNIENAGVMSTLTSFTNVGTSKFYRRGGKVGKGKKTRKNKH